MKDIEKIEKAIETINKECESTFLLLNCSNEFAEALATAITYMERHKTLLEGIEKVREEIRAEVIGEVFNINCKDVSQNECDGYGGRCYQCKYERLVQKSLKMQGLKEKNR